MNKPTFIAIFALILFLSLSAEDTREYGITEFFGDVVEQVI